MNAIIFIGPTITEAQAREHLDAQYHPPAQQGDIYLAAKQKPQAIGLIDGRFDQVDAVAHKEILWAMAQGIHVFGAASMGALRAAELSCFGMVGVGAIYQQYRDELLIDDDEVAVAHACAEHGHRALSVAMVNIRATLAAAVTAGHISAADCARLETMTKKLFYADRTYPALLELAAEVLDDGQLSALTEHCLRSGRIHQKQRDARAMLDLMRQQLDQGLNPKSVRYAFNHTDAWQTVVARAHAREAKHFPIDKTRHESLSPQHHSSNSRKHFS